MTREQAKELLPIIQAYAEGKAIQVRGMKPETNWVDADEKDLDLLTASFTEQWRVKPEPREGWSVGGLWNSKEEAENAMKALVYFGGKPILMKVREVLE